MASNFPLSEEHEQDLHLRSSARDPLPCERESVTIYNMYGVGGGGGQIL